MCYIEGVKKIISYECRLTFICLLFTLSACTSSNRNSSQMQNETKNYPEGSYGYDVAFLAENKIETLELKDTETGACVLVAPGLQGRVMTSASGGYSGASHGWINYRFIRSGAKSGQFNPYGGEERFWIGPEGGPFSIYFKKGDEQVFANWQVPGAIDTEAFDVVEKDDKKARFSRNFSLTNAAGTKMDIQVDRTVKVLAQREICQALLLEPGKTLGFVAFETENILTNRGENDWDENNGFLSIWLLCMFNPSEKGVVCIPYKTGGDISGKIVTDDYFGKVPVDRLLVKDGVILFKTDGKYRSKIGISPERALPYCGSYDADKRLLTVLWYSRPERPSRYVNSVWGEQDNPLNGDVVNAYNDGPTDDGSVMGPFYEIESSSPAALLKAGEKITHIQRIFHFSGEEHELGQIAEKLFGVSLDEIKNAFQ